MRYTPTGEISWHEARTAIAFRTHGPCIIYNDGSVFFSQLHEVAYNRTAGPSRIYFSGYIRYTNLQGEYHRTDGPAVIKADGSKEYWVYDVRLTAEEFFLKYGVL